MAHKVTLIRAIAEYDAAYRALGHYKIPSGPNWDADVRRVESLGLDLLAFQCSTHRQYLRWYRYIRSVPDLSRKVSPDKARAGSLAVRAREAAQSGRASGAAPTYEFGIEGSDRVPVAAPVGQWNRLKKRYPFDVMEVGETVFLPGLKSRAQIGPALLAAQKQHDRKFTTKAEADGLRIRRTA